MSKKVFFVDEKNKLPLKYRNVDLFKKKNFIVEFILVIIAFIRRKNYGINIKLYNFQKNIINFIYNYEQCQQKKINTLLKEKNWLEGISQSNKIICINDEPGYGKTYSVLGLLKYSEEKDKKNFLNPINIIICSIYTGNKWITKFKDMNMDVNIIQKNRYEYDPKINNFLVEISGINDFLKIMKDEFILRIFIDELTSNQESRFNYQRLVNKVLPNCNFKYLITSKDNIVKELKKNIIFIKNNYYDVKFYKTNIKYLENKDNLFGLSKLNIEKLKNFDFEEDSLDFLINNLFRNKIQNLIKLKKDSENNKSKIEYETNCIKAIMEKINEKECFICLQPHTNYCVNHKLTKYVYFCCSNTICCCCKLKLDNTKKCPYCNTEIGKMHPLTLLKFSNKDKIIVNLKEIENLKFNNMWFNNNNANSKNIINSLKYKDYDEFKDENSNLKILLIHNLKDLKNYSFEYVTHIITSIDKLQELEPYINLFERIDRKKSLNILVIQDYKN